MIYARAVADYRSATGATYRVIPFDLYCQRIVNRGPGNYLPQRRFVLQRELT